MRVVLDEGAIAPTRAHSTDAGLDLYSRETKTIHGHSYESFDTGVHVELEPGTAGFLKSKSGLNVKHHIQSEGVIDVGYTGPIVVKMYNRGPNSYVVNKGDKITQLVVVKIDTPEIEIVDSLNETERGDNGFGSSGK